MSRSTVINEMSSSVTGIFKLHDLLAIRTMSGHINITIVPQPASDAKAPAEIHLSTASGSIRVNMAPFLHDPSTVLPERVFNSYIKSLSGSIDAALVHNHQTSLSTMSGNISAAIYPLSLPRPVSSHIGVHNLSGFTSLTLHPHIHTPQTGLKALSADFGGSSGNLRFQFPSTWEGEVSTHLSSGRVRHQWEGLQVLNGSGSSFRAVKGRGEGKLRVCGNSMDVELVGVRVPGLSREEEEARGEGDRVSSLGREVEVQAGEPVPDFPRDEGRQERVVEEDDDEDDWTIVGDEDGVEEATRRPPPPYEEAVRT